MTALLFAPNPALRAPGRPAEPRLDAAAWVDAEAAGLLERIDRLEPFRRAVPMVATAALDPRAERAIGRELAMVSRELRVAVGGLRRSLRARVSDPPALHRRLVTLKLRFNALLTNLDLFADAVVQRSEHRVGTWLAGLDALAADALRLPGGYYEAPPVVCYLDRGLGAAIRRTRTRLPGGGRNPVALIQVPRERMVGAALAPSLVHEVGHQVAGLLGLDAALEPALALAARDGRPAWRYFQRWISEILADLWAVGRLGIAATRGVMSVMTLPRSLAFQTPLDDPHPGPWIRGKLGCAFGRRLYPDQPWDALAALWEAFQPLDGLEPRQAALLRHLEATLPDFVELVLGSRPSSLLGRPLGEVLQLCPGPARLAHTLSLLRRRARLHADLPPCEAFAALGQGRLFQLLSPAEEATLAGRLLAAWADRNPLTHPSTRG